MDNAILCKIESTIEKYELLKRGDRILVALSGGADSVFLLNALLFLKEKLELTVFAAHINHGLRGKDSDFDEKFCEKYCKEKNVQIFIKKADVAKIANQKGVSEEVAGRMVRYDYFRKVAIEHNLDKIATAHNQDDNVETVLMRFLRGSGILGLCGIPYKNDNIIRPILDVSRREIEEFLEVNKISFVTDKTNFEQVYTRNKLRLSLIPEIEEGINSGFKKSLVSNISLYNECSDFLINCENDAYSGCVTEQKFHIEADVKRLMSNHNYIIKSIIKKILLKLSGEASYEAVCSSLDVLEGKKSKINVSGGVTVASAYGKMFFYAKLPDEFCYFNVSDCVCIKETGAKICFTKALKIEKKLGKNVFFADGDKLKNVTVRSRKDGDVFFPSGENGGKVKLKDYFINSKIPLHLRGTIPVVLSGDDIIWIAGFRHAKEFAAKDDTKNIVKIEIIDGGF